MAASKAPASFKGLFESACGTLEPYRVWSLFVNVTASHLARAALLREPWNGAAVDDAESEGLTDTFARMYGCVVDAFEENPDRDFLGDEYMRLGISDSGKGQFFTPYHLSRACADASITADRLSRLIGSKGFVTVYEPSVGAGSMPIAAFNRIRELVHNPQTEAWFELHELSNDTAMACYVQAAVLGMAGCVVVGDTLSDEPGRRLWLPMNVISPVWSTRLLGGDLPC